MRVIAGTLRGRRFRAPAGRDTRPTSDRVRESMFNLIGPVPAGGRVLDLFAGSGALGIEALSRGAARAIFVEKARGALTALRQNLEELGLADVARVIAGDSLDDLPLAEGPFDLVLADPPYRAGLAEAILRDVAPGMAPGGVVVLEHSADDPPPEPPEGLALWKTRRYGGTSVTLYSRPEESS